MDVSQIIQYAVIIGVLLVAVPFPIALVASAVAWALADFVAVESLWNPPEEPRGGRQPGG